MLAHRILDDRLLVPIIAGWKLNVQEILILVDTGFTGELKVTPKVAEELGLEITDTRFVKMADGKEIACGYSLARVSLEGVEKEVSVLIFDGLSLIGVQLLKRFEYCLNADFVDETFVLQKKRTSLFDEDG